jgi:hypothetical protein
MNTKDAELKPVDFQALREGFNTTIVEMTSKEVREWIYGIDPLEDDDLRHEADMRQGEDGTSYLIIKIVKEA